MIDVEDQCRDFSQIAKVGTEQVTDQSRPHLSWPLLSNPLRAWQSLQQRTSRKNLDAPLFCGSTHASTHTTKSQGTLRYLTDQSHKFASHCRFVDI